MKLTEVQRAIILINIIGTTLDEYSDIESTASISELKQVCRKFVEKQSGVEFIKTRTKHGKITTVPKVVNEKRYRQYYEMSQIGDRIWQSTIDKYAKQQLKIDAVAMIESIWLPNESILTKHARLNRSRIDAYRFEHEAGDRIARTDGTAIGGYLLELLAEEMGEKVNGKLRALRLRIQDHIQENAA